MPASIVVLVQVEGSVVPVVDMPLPAIFNPSVEDAVQTPVPIPIAEFPAMPWIFPPAPCTNTVPVVGNALPPPS